MLKVGEILDLEEKKEALKAISENIALCKKCELCQSRTNTVPGYGNPDADIVIVGEAPGASEDEQGKPFVGRSGQLLTKMLERVGIQRDDVFICNTLKCRPPENRDPSAQEMRECRSFLEKQLEIINPKVIVALGTHAAQDVLEKMNPIGDLRGEVWESSFGVPVIPTYHPAYILRNRTKAEIVLNDLKKALEYV